MGQFPESDIGSYPLRHFTVRIRSTSQVAANTTPAVRLAVDSHATDVLQPGMQSAGYPGLWLSDQERRLRHFHHTISEFMETSPKP